MVRIVILVALALLLLERYIILTREPDSIRCMGGMEE